MEDNNDRNIVPSNWRSFSFSDPVSPREQPLERILDHDFAFTDIEDAKQSESADVVSPPNGTSSAATGTSRAQNFSFAVHKKSTSPARRKKLPPFERMGQIESELNVLAAEIKQQKEKIVGLQRRDSRLKEDRSRIALEVEQWTKNYRLWDCDDFMAWIFQIDHGYFKMKWTINRWERVLLFPHHSFFDVFGQRLGFFDVLNVQQLFPFLDPEDCRKLFSEIEELTASERDRRSNKIDSLCAICTTNKKAYARRCGHIYCESCDLRMESCAVCKTKKTYSSIRVFWLFVMKRVRGRSTLQSD